MPLPNQFDLPEMRDKEGALIGYRLPSREEVIRRFNDLLAYLEKDRKDQEGKVAPEPVEEEECLEVDGWPSGTGHSISNMGDTGFTVEIRDSRFRSWQEAREFAELMRDLLSSPRVAKKPNLPTE